MLHQEKLPTFGSLLPVGTDKSRLLPFEASLPMTGDLDLKVAPWTDEPTNYRLISFSQGAPVTFVHIPPLEFIGHGLRAF